MNKAAILSAVFHEVMGRTTSFSIFDDRLETQKIVYLLDELDVSCGDYSFIWYKRGPYSQQLQNTMLCYDQTQNDETEVNFSEKGMAALNTLKEIFSVDYTGYNEAYWIETLASILFLSKRIIPVANEARVLSELQNRKPHLKSKDINRRAYQILQDKGFFN